MFFVQFQLDLSFPRDPLLQILFLYCVNTRLTEFTSRECYAFDSIRTTEKRKYSGTCSILFVSRLRNIYIFVFVFWETALFSVITFNCIRKSDVDNLRILSTSRQIIWTLTICLTIFFSILRNKYYWDCKINQSVQSTETLHVTFIYQCSVWWN